jgi:hypothetical protein
MADLEHAGSLLRMGHKDFNALLGMQGNSLFSDEQRLDYEEWALEQIDAGLADIKTGRVLSDDEFWKQISARHESKKAA